jgi:hypothetical protein
MARRAYWTIDAEYDAVHSICAALDSLRLVDKRPHYWKWFIVGLHSAIQGALVLALNNDNSVLVQKPGVSRKMLAAFAGDQDFPSPYMDNFLGLYCKAMNAEHLRQGAIPVPDNPVHLRAIRTLDELRDEFLHFNYKTWSIERDLLIECPQACCEVLSHLLVTSNSIRWHQLSLPKKAVSSLGKLELLLRNKAKGNRTGIKTRKNGVRDTSDPSAWTKNRGQRSIS